MEFLGESLHYLLSFIVIISVIVFIHEFGHFWVARRCGVKVEAFAIGFGPELFGWTDKHLTRWKVCAFPLGGYVKMFGDAGAASTPDGQQLHSMTEEQKAQAFHFKPLRQKAAVVVAGPLANFILAAVILSFFFVVYGRPESAPKVGEVIADSAALEAGLQEGDVITELNGSGVERFEDIRQIVSLRPGETLSMTYKRDGKEIHGTITPRLMESKDVFGNKVRAGIIGIRPAGVNYRTMGVLEAIPAGIVKVYQISANTLQAVGQMIVGRRSSDELSGILRIGQYSGQATEQGMTTVLWFMAVLSVNLGLINLFPIPMLDGGHLLFYAIEAVKGKPLADRFQEWGYRIGFALLITLMVFATYNDLRHFELF